MRSSARSSRCMLASSSGFTVPRIYCVHNVRPCFPENGERVFVFPISSFRQIGYGPGQPKHSSPVIDSLLDWWRTEIKCLNQFFSSEERISGAGFSSVRQLLSAPGQADWFPVETGLEAWHP